MVKKDKRKRPVDEGDSRVKQDKAKFGRNRRMIDGFERGAENRDT